MRTPARRGGRRRLAVLGAVLFGGYAAYILTATVRGRGLDLISGSLLAFTATAAAYCAWFALRAGDPRSRPRLRAGCVGGAALGGAGFLAGLVAPLLWTPDAVQGPLLALLVTGPLGFVLGVAGGVAVRMGRERASGGVGRGGVERRAP